MPSESHYGSAVASQVSRSEVPQRVRFDDNNLVVVPPSQELYPERLPVQTNRTLGQESLDSPSGPGGVPGGRRADLDELGDDDSATMSAVIVNNAETAAVAMQKVATMPPSAFNAKV